jgi:NADH-quinone oxidoreductase subunit D
MDTAVQDLRSSIDVTDDALESQMTLSMGPQHPSTHGVLRLDLRLDGELVVKAIPDIGYLHTGMEKLFEYKKYQQGIVITDRMDYLNPLGNNLAYVMAAEKLLGLEIPERAQVIRVLMCALPISINEHTAQRATYHPGARILPLRSMRTAAMI